MNIIGYLRVSTNKQAEHGHGLDVQRKAIRVWAASNGHRVVAWYTDAGTSGADELAARNALPDAMADLQAKRSAGLAVYRLDRLARDVIIQETLIRDIRRMKADVFTTSAAEAEDCWTTRTTRHAR